MTTLRIAQEARYVGGERWKWSVWIEGTDRELNGIESVTWHLHPTFPDPIRVVTDRRTKFRLDTSGWGMFTINAEIRRKGGRPIKRSHDLVLESPEETPTLRSHRGRPTVFLASSVADRPIVSALREQLHKEGFRFKADTDLDPSLPLDVSVEQALKSSDAVIGIVSDFPSPGVESEIRMARSMEVPVVPIWVGKGRDRPESIRDVETISLHGPEEVPAVARRVVESLHRALGSN